MRFFTLVLVAVSAIACSPNAPSASLRATDLASSSAPASAAASPSTAASATPREPAGSEQTSVFDLEVGDCFSASAERIESMTVVDCVQPHVYETFAVLDHPADEGQPFPGNEIGEYADTACQPAFEAFVGIGYPDSTWFITTLPPTEETWAAGDREIVCTLNNEQESEVTGSARGSGE